MSEPKRLNISDLPPAKGGGFVLGTIPKGGIVRDVLKFSDPSTPLELEIEEPDGALRHIAIKITDTGEAECINHSIAPIPPQS